MKKLLLLLIFVLPLSFQAQYNQDAPWMKNINSANAKSSTKTTFKDVVNAFDLYWETRNKDLKGSGHKPFKRWETYWKNFVKKDGTLPTSQELWNTWLTVKQLKQNKTFTDASSWQPVGPFEYLNTGSWSSGQGRVNAIIVDPNNANTYYAGAPAGGIWKSTNAGASWTPLADNLPQIGVSGIAIDPSNSNIIYIATGDDDNNDSSSVGVMKSIDGGITWNSTGININNSPDSMNDIYIHPTNSNILWVATDNGVYKTTNGGTSWSNANGTVGLNIKDIKIKPNNPDLIYAVSKSSFYISVDGGDAFTTSGSGLPNVSNRLVIDVTPANPNVVYALSADDNDAFQGLYKSIDSGISFTEVASNATVGDIFDGSTQSWFDMALAVSNTNENEVYTGVLNIWKSTNSGSTFTKLNDWQAPSSASYTHADIHFLRFYNDELFAGTDGGIYKTIDGGVNFTDLTAGMQIGQFYRIAVSKQSSQKMVGGLQDNGGYALNNSIWQNYYGADGMDTAINPLDSNLMYGFIQYGSALVVSASSGASLDNYIGAPAAETGTDDSGGNWITPLAINKNGELFAGYSQIYTLNGEWQQVSTNLGGSNIEVLELDPINTDIIYVGDEETLKKSTDKGISFTDTEIFSRKITSIEVNNNDNSIVYVTTSGIFGSIYKSTDGGDNFIDISGSLPNVTKNIIKHQNLHTQNPLFLGTSLGVYRYDDSIGDWELFENNLPNVSVRDLEINLNDTNITAATYGRGIWQSTIPTEVLTNEISLEKIQNINQTISCGNVDNAQILVKNLGINTINSINIAANLNGNITNSVWNGTLNQDASTLIDMPSLAISNFGNQQLEVTITTGSDTFQFNNTLTSYFYANASENVNTINNFETINDALISYNEGSINFNSGYWERGIPSGTLLNTASSGTSVYATNLAGNYVDSMKSYLVSECYDLSILSNPTLKFNMAFNLERNWDILYLEYSIDSGISWNILGTASDLNWYNSDRTNASSGGADCFNCPGAQWTGSNTSLNEYSYNLDSLNNESSLLFRFVFHSDESVNEEGVIIDDLVVEGTTLSNKTFDSTNFSIYPNPSENIFNIKTRTFSNFNYSITDVTGKTIIKKKNAQINQNAYQLNMANFAPGVYFLNIEISGGRLSKKLILN